MRVIKKDGHIEQFDPDKIKIAVTKSANRIGYSPTDEDWNNLFNLISPDTQDDITVENLHKEVENALLQIMPDVGHAYASYRNYKKDYARMMESVLKSADDLNYKIDRSNANTTAALISSQRSLIFTALSKEIYKKLFLSNKELEAIQDGFIYIHDIGSRAQTYNCCLFDIGKVLKGGFEWEHIAYNEPKDVRTACNLISDITLNCAAQQYGGFTLSEIDSVLAPYAEKSYKKYLQQYYEIAESETTPDSYINEKHAHEWALKQTKRDIQQGFQGFEHTFNTVASSRGDYPFVTMTGGCEESMFGQLVWETALQVRAEGQGVEGKKRPAIFPKLVFLYTKELHAKDKPLHHLFIEGVKCSAKAMYPDWLSLDMPDESIITNAAKVHFEPSIAKVFKKYHQFGISRWYLDENNKVQENEKWVDSIISPMGKRKLQLI